MAGSERIRMRQGHVVVESEGTTVRRVSLKRGPARTEASSALAADLRRYFAGERVDFSRYDVDYEGYTPFQRAVLEATRRIPWGETRTYGEIAADVGKPGAARAVGQAVGANRTCIVVPCHRVVASNGLGGFTGGLHWKKDLLALEGAPRNG